MSTLISRVKAVVTHQDFDLYSGATSILAMFLLAREGMTGLALLWALNGGFLIGSWAQSKFTREWRKFALETLALLKELDETLRGGK